MRDMTGFDALTWIDVERGWHAAPDDVVTVLAAQGFEECKRETTTSRRDRQLAGGVWQGVDPRTGSVASAVWVNRVTGPGALVFIEVDGESLMGGPGRQDEP
jgi:hypothetical protein